MKGTHPVITLLGSHSGNNLGDAAILSSILESFTKLLPHAEFLVPSPKPEFIDNNYGKKYNAKGIDIMPKTLSVRFFGFPTFKALYKSDIALILDGIIFGKQLFNPAFNFLIVLVFVVPIARMLGCKVVCYSCGIGPFPVIFSKTLAKWTLNACDLVIMRENDSKKLAEDIGVTKPITVTGDAAFINPVSDDSVGKEILSNHGASSGPYIGLNVTSYFDGWLAPHERLSSKEAFLEILEGAFSEVSKSTGAKIVLFSTHPMDDPAVDFLGAKLNAVIVKNKEFLSHDIQAAMRQCDLFVGMRFHSIILASAVEVPVVALLYAPKVKGYMRQLGCEDLGLELHKLTKENLTQSLLSAWESRTEIKQKQKAVIDTLKEGAQRAAQTVAQRYF